MSQIDRQGPIVIDGAKGYTVADMGIYRYSYVLDALE